jgi:hypothetical protein
MQVSAIEQVFVEQLKLVFVNLAEVVDSFLPQSALGC